MGAKRKLKLVFCIWYLVLCMIVVKYTINCIVKLLICWKRHSDESQNLFDTWYLILNTKYSWLVRPGRLGLPTHCLKVRRLADLPTDIYFIILIF